MLGGYAGFRSYKIWKQRHIVTLAKSYMEKGDGRNTLLCLQQALRSNPRNLEANRLMAIICEATHDHNAVVWWSRVLEMNPKSFEDRLGLVRAALSAHDLRTASKTLDGVDPTNKKTAEYHNAAAAVAISMGKNAEAEAHFQEVVKLNPRDPLPQLNLAVIHMHSTNSQVASEARAILNVISLNPTNGNLRCQALRQLVADSVATKKFSGAVSITQQLLRETNANFGDRLLQLSVYKIAKRPEFLSLVSNCQRDAGNDLPKIGEFIRWQMNEMSPSDALVWIKTLPSAIQTNQPVALLMAECRESAKDWRGLESSLAKQNWGELEFIRFAFRCRALRSLDLGTTAKLEWDKAMNAANYNLKNLVSLLRLVSQWRWNNEIETILLAINNRYPEETWATQTLAESYYAEGQTRSLFSLFKNQFQNNPKSLTAKNNLAMIGMLLNATEVNPYGLANDIYTAAPTNASVVSTYAFSLYLQKKNAEALKAIETISPKELENPTIAGYYGLILNANHNKVKGQKYLDIALKSKLLPEERKLMSSAR